MNDIQNEAAYSNQVIEMLKVAHEYCLYLESAENISADDIHPFVQRITPLLYLKGSLLPIVSVEDEEIGERFVTEEEWENIFTNLRDKLINTDEFWVLDYNSPDQTDPIKASASEILADLYQDLKDFVMLYQKTSRSSKQIAARDCKHLFETHWGAKSLSLLQWVHYLNHKNVNDNSYSDLF